MDNQIGGGEPRLATSQVRVSKGLSLVWLVPLTALAIAGWLLFKTWSEQGERITIHFKKAAGIEAGKARIKYKDVEIGQVESITLSQDMREVVITARMSKVATPYLTEKAKFWIVQPKITASRVSGLDTLFSGTYIAMDPGRGGESRRDFVGLEEVPPVTTDAPGRYFNLKAEGLGSLDIDSPVYYRQIKVGQVVGYGFDASGRSVNIRIFVNSPHDQQVNNNTRFWNASGINLSLDATGVKLATESLASIVSGGIAFDLPPHAAPSGQATENQVFDLYPSKDAISQENYHYTDSWLLYFDQSVRGLTVGAPVEFRGIRIGVVSSIDLEFESAALKFRTPVVVAIDPERFFGKDTDISHGNGLVLLKKFVGHGLRAVLKSGNLLTGQLLIDFDFYPKEPSASLAVKDSLPVMPTKQAELQQITDTLNSLLGKLETIPFAQLGQDLHLTLKSARRTMDELPVKEMSQELGDTLKEARISMREIDALSRNLNRQTAPALTKALEQLTLTLNDLEDSLGSDSPTNYQLQQTLHEMTMTSRSLRGLTDYLERHPDSLIYGKGQEASP